MKGDTTTSLSQNNIKKQIVSTLLVIGALFFLFWGEKTLPFFYEVLPGGLRVNYFQGIDLKKRLFTKTERKVEKGYSKESSAWKVSKGHFFSAVWEGFIKIPADDLYHFKILSDDGSRLFIKNKLIINHWGEHPFIPKVGNTWLAKGKYPIRIEYFNKRGTGKIRLKWYAENGKIQSGSVLAVPYLSKW